MALPDGVKYAIIGAGIHGLSTAYHLAVKLRENGTGSGKDIVIFDKSGIAAGASGIACGVVRNNYFQPAMRELMAQSVEVWGQDKDAFTLLDGEFHEHLARCSKNPLLLNFLQQISRIRTHAQWRVMKEDVLTPKQIKTYNKQHRAMYDALRERNVSRAVSLIGEHLEKAKADLIGVDSD